MNIDQVEKAIMAAEAVLAANPGGHANPMALTEFRAQMDAISQERVPAPSIVGHAKDLAEKLYSERGWIGRGTPQAVGNQLAQYLRRLRMEFRHRQEHPQPTRR